MSKKTFILVRHAHRDTDNGRDRDNGLSGKGRDQAKAFRDDVLDLMVKGTVLLSSPKKRCVETLEPLAKKAGLPIEVDKLLDEQDHGESYGALERRIELFVGWVSASEHPVIVACSHGDWIPLFCETAASLPRDFKKGEWHAFEVTDKGPWKLIED